MLTQYLFFFGFGLVAANPILQRIPLQLPSQYTAQCPTCPTQTCPTQTCPTTRPPCQNCQNYRSVYNPQARAIPSNNCPCNKQVTVQNPVANPTQDALSQMVIRRLLNPQPQMPVNQASAKPCNSDAQKPVPNIINNYIIIPPEFFKANETTVDKDETVKRRRKGKRRKQIHRSQKSPACPCEENELIVKTTDEEENATPCPCEKQNITKAIGRADIKGNKVDVKSSPTNKTSKEKSLPESVTRSKATNTSQTVLPISQDVPSKKTHTYDNNNLDIKKPRKEIRERPRNLEEAIIRDFCKKHPTVPEEIARSLLRKLVNQIGKKENTNYMPYPFGPFDYGHFDPRLFYPRYDEYARAYSDRVESDRRSRKRKPLRGVRRNKKPKEDIKQISHECDEKCEKLEINPSAINIEMETITTEKITATTEKKVKDSSPTKNSETQMETPDDLLDQLDQMKAKFAKLNEIETTTVSYNKRTEQYPELGKEDKVPTLYDNGVEDYYPNFRGDTVQFYASDEECDSKEDNTNHDSKRHGSIDSKRYVNEPKTIEKQNYHQYETSTERSYPASTESYESYEEQKDDEEVRFIIPPHLELPDFETKQINTAQINVTPELKPAKVFTKDKSGRTNIETVYGHSRVLKYGRDEEEAASEPVITYYLPEEAMTEDRIQLPDGEGIVVVAKSIRDLKDDW